MGSISLKYEESQELAILYDVQKRNRNGIHLLSM